VTRAQRLLKRAMAPVRTAEDFAAAFARPIGYKSGRTVRRWLKGESPIPREVAEWLRDLFKEAPRA
jgi:hypothetical protein